MGEDDVEEYSVGDLIRVHDSVDAELFIFRPPSFPFGKIGLVFEIKTRHDPSYLTPTDVNRYPYIDYEYNIYYEDLVGILIEGQKYWVFKDEIQLYKNEKD